MKSNEFLLGEEPQPTVNPVDKITMDVPLLIRIMEFAKEDAQDDMALHRVAEKLIAMSKSGKTLSMQDYDSVVGNQKMDEDATAGATCSSAMAVGVPTSLFTPVKRKPSKMMNVIGKGIYPSKGKK